MKVKFKKLDEIAQCPWKKNKWDAGYDLFSINDYFIHDKTVIKVDTGIAIEIPEGYVGLIWDRSGMGSRGFKVHGGVIDSTYRGPIKVCLSYHGNENTFFNTVQINRGDRVAQLLIQPIINVEWEEVTELEKSNRGDKGFGASGR